MLLVPQLVAQGTRLRLGMVFDYNMQTVQM